jgi:hypothetical protein
VNALLRVYFDPAEIGPDGYPHPWHRPTPYFATGDVRAERIADDPATGDTRVLVSQEAGIGHWPAIKDYVREQAGNRCERCGHPYEKGMGEWSPCDEHCTHGGPVRDLDGYDQDVIEHSRTEAQWRILTVHHLNGVKHDCRWWNLAALCQRCHLTIQAKVHLDRPYDRPHTEWFRPHAAGYYASEGRAGNLAEPDTILCGAEPSREWVLEHMDEILEIHATQGTLL